jgi:hypothetical protein
MLQPKQKRVFISYSHNDRNWRDALEMHLKPYLHDGSIVGWSDRNIAPGSDWFKEIQAALMNSNVAILLVSPSFIASDFIRKHELGPLLKEAEQGGVKIMWVAIYASSYKQTALEKYQAVLDPSKPLANITKAKRDQAWVKICEEIHKVVSPSTKPILKGHVDSEGENSATLRPSTLSSIFSYSATDTAAIREL